MMQLTKGRMAAIAIILAAVAAETGFLWIAAALLVVGICYGIEAGGGN